MMSLPIISADQRRAEKRGVKMALLGKSGKASYRLPLLEGGTT